MYSGTITIAEFPVTCAVLNDGSRVLTQTGFLELIGRNQHPKTSANSQVDETPAFLSAQNLQPYIRKHVTRSTSPVLFQPLRVGGSLAIGYPAELLPEVCNVFLAARADGALHHTQLPIADRCDILVRGLTLVGITALVDEATGYQQARQRNALNKILEAFIAKELMPWTKRFPDEFYEQMFRLRGWAFNEESLSRRPGFAGTLTNQLVYEKLAPGVLAELQRVNPTDGHGRRKSRHHQLLTVDIGHPALQKHVTRVTTAMELSDSWTGFMYHFAKLFPTDGQQTYIDVDDDALEQEPVA